MKLIFTLLFAMFSVATTTNAQNNSPITELEAKQLISIGNKIWNARCGKGKNLVLIFDYTTISESKFEPELTLSCPKIN